MDELTKYYKASLLNGLCAEYKGRWQAAHGNLKKLIDMAISQQALPHFMSYAYDGTGLSKEYFTTTFADYINGRYTAVDVDGTDGGFKTQIYAGTGADMVTLDEADVAAFMWSEDTPIIVSRCKAVKIYCGCRSRLHVVCDGYNSITLMVFDESQVVLEDVDADSVVNVYCYGENSSIEIGKYCMGKINEHKNKTLRL